MSLDITLYGEVIKEKCVCTKCNHEHEVEHREYLYEANITHNLGGMADEAGIYQCLWHPKENGINKASQLIGPLNDAIVKMEKDPEHYKAFDAKNGWGLYIHFLPWLKKLLTACLDYPDAEVYSSI